MGCGRLGEPGVVPPAPPCAVTTLRLRVAPGEAGPCAPAPAAPPPAVVETRRLAPPPPPAVVVDVRRLGLVERLGLVSVERRRPGERVPAAAAAAASPAARPRGSARPDARFCCGEPSPVGWSILPSLSSSVLVSTCAEPSAPGSLPSCRAESCSADAAAAAMAVVTASRDIEVRPLASATSSRAAAVREESSLSRSSRACASAAGARAACSAVAASTSSSCSACCVRTILSRARCSSATTRSFAHAGARPPAACSRATSSSTVLLDAEEAPAPRIDGRGAGLPTRPATLSAAALAAARAVVDQSAVPAATAPRSAAAAAAELVRRAAMRLGGALNAVEPQVSRRERCR